MKTKAFDCVEMKRRGAARIHQKTKDMSFEQKVAYWERANQEFLHGDKKTPNADSEQTQASKEFPRG